MEHNRNDRGICTLPFSSETSITVSALVREQLSNYKKVAALMIDSRVYRNT